MQCSRFGTQIQNQGAGKLYTIFTFFPSWNLDKIYFDISDSFHLIFTIMRLYLFESLKGISITPSRFPIFKFSKVFEISDLGMDASILGIHIEFCTIDIFGLLYYSGILVYVDFDFFNIKINFLSHNASDFDCVKS